MNEGDHAQAKQSGFPIGIERRLEYFFKHLPKLAPVLQGDRWTRELLIELLMEIDRVRTETAEAAEKTSPDPSNTEPTAEDVHRWEREVRLLQGQAISRSWMRMTPDLRKALRGDVLNFIQAHGAHCKVSSDFARLDTDRPIQALEISSMDQAAAESILRLRGTAEEGLTADQFNLAKAARERKGEEPPDFWTMLERLERAAADLKVSKTPPKNCSPKRVLVKSPPKMAQEGFIPRQSIDVEGGEPCSPALAEELPSCSSDGLEATEAFEAAIEAAKAARVLRELKPLVRELAAQRAKDRTRHKYQDIARRSLAPLALRELTTAFVARLEGVPENSWSELRRAVRGEVAQIRSDSGVRALARRAGL